MDFKITGRNLTIEQSIREHVERKLERLVRHLPAITGVEVELTRNNSRDPAARIVAQVTLDVNGTVLRGEEKGATATAAVDEALDVMDRRMERLKGRLYRSQQTKRSSVSRMQAEAAPDLDPETTGDEADESGGVVVKTKRFPMKPMTVEDAAFQMDMLGHEFFLFLNAETGEHNVVYRRADGDYGLIQPEPL
jgi:putative sigma-54 modulation protein